MSRKTIDVEVLKDTINLTLLNSADDYQDGREALINMIERVLMSTSNYGGYGYLDVADMESSDQGTTVGINELRGESLPMDKRFEGTDHTRVKYF